MKFLAAIGAFILALSNNAGAAYGSGRGTERNSYKSQQFYRKACLAGYGESCRNLGMMYLSKRELGNEPDKARTWIKKGCDLSSASSCATYGTMLRAGMGCEGDV